MTTITTVIVTLVAILHVYFLVLEMYFWEKPLGLRAFGLTPDLQRASSTTFRINNIQVDSPMPDNDN